MCDSFQTYDNRLVCFLSMVPPAKLQVRLFFFVQTTNDQFCKWTYFPFACTVGVQLNILLLYTRYMKLYLKSAFNFNISNISYQGYFTDKQSERLYKYKHITNHRKFGLISQKFTLLKHRYL